MQILTGHRVRIPDHIDETSDVHNRDLVPERITDNDPQDVPTRDYDSTMANRI